MMHLKEVFPFPTHLLIGILIHQVFDHYHYLPTQQGNLIRALFLVMKKKGSVLCQYLVVNEGSLQWCSCFKE